MGSLTVHQAAAYLQVAPRQVIRWTGEGRLAGRYYHDLYLYKEEEVVAFRRVADRPPRRYVFSRN
jgi:hypothetical protein